MEPLCELLLLLPQWRLRYRSALYILNKSAMIIIFRPTHRHTWFDNRGAQGHHITTTHTTFFVFVFVTD